MAAAAHVLRFARSDEEGGFVLVHTRQTRSKALDMKLIGTDGLAPYVVNLRHSQAAAHMSKNCPVSEEEWIDILTSLLRQEVVEGVEGIASVESEKAIVLNLRKRVRGITQRLGTIELKHSPEEEIELYDWCGASVEAATGAKESLASVTANSKELEASVDQLRAQLDELIEAKKADEVEMLHKFRDLLNEKKIKIREQQKIIATASVDAAGIESPKSSPEPPSRERVAGKSRSSKRKAPAQEPEEDGESSDGFEKMDAVPAAQEQKDRAGQLSDDERQTSGGETETASEDGEGGDEDEDMEGTEQPVKTRSATRANAPSSTSQSQLRSQSTSQSTASKKGEEPPAKRELPFGRKRAEPSKKAAPPSQAGGSETESDDEL